MSKVDFSILNETDIFYALSAYEWLFKGNPIGTSSGLCIGDEETYQDSTLFMDISCIQELRKANENELELFYKHFPGQKRYRKKMKNYLTIKDMQEAGWKFKYTK